MKAGYDTVPKIIAMSEEDYLKVDGFKKKMAEKVYNSIRKKIAAAPLTKIMAVSNIFGRGFGERRIEPILAKYPDMLKNSTMYSDEEKNSTNKIYKRNGKENSREICKEFTKVLGVYDCSQIGK